jgi:hypothetical protein
MGKWCILTLFFVSPIAYAQQFSAEQAPVTTTTSSPGLVHNWLANQNFAYDNQYLNQYGVGFHTFPEQTGGINTYISGYFGVDFFSAAQLRMRIAQNGRVGIGTADPAKNFHISGTTEVEQWIEVVGDGYAALALKSNGKQWQWSKRPSIYGDMLQLYHHNGSNWTAPPFTVLTNGNIGIGTETPGSFKLAVNGKIWTQEVNVAMTNPGPDYVFEKDYELLPLSKLETYINQNKHLPEVPSAKEMEKDGLNLKEMNLLLLKKVEELTLHLIEMKKENEIQQKEINALKNEDRK